MGVRHAVFTYRPDDKSGQLTVAAASDYKEVGVLGAFNQHRSGTAFHYLRLDLQVRIGMTYILNDTVDRRRRINGSVIVGGERHPSAQTQGELPRSDYLQ
jgi:hypothetical protein